MAATNSAEKVLQQIDAGVEPTAFGDYFRDLLVDTTLNSIAENHVPELVAQAVSTGIWTTEYAIRLAKRIADPQRKANMIAALLPLQALNDEQRQDLEQAAFQAIEAVDFDDTKFHCLVALGQGLTGAPKETALQQALDLALQLDSGNEPRYQSAMWMLAPHLSGDLLTRAVKSTGAIKAAQTRAWACAALARQLDGDQKTAMLHTGLDAALAIDDELHRANALCQLADQLTGAMVEQALQATLSMENEQWRPRVIDTLAGRLNEVQKSTALEAALTIQHPWYRAHALVGLLRHLTGDPFSRGLDAALAVDSDEAKALVVSRLDFPADVLPRVLEVVLAIADEKYRFEALVNLLPRLEGSQKQQVLAIALQFIAAQPSESPSSQHRYIYPVIRLAAQLDGSQRQQLLSQALDTILQIPDEEDRGYLLQTLLGDLPDDLLPRFVEGTLVLKNHFQRIRLLSEMAIRLSPDLLKRALADCSIVDDYAARAFALTRLAGLLTGSERETTVQYALQAAQSSQIPWERADSLSFLIPELEEKQRAGIVVQVLETVRLLPDNDGKVKALAALLPYVGNQQSAEIYTLAYDTSNRIKYDEMRSRARVELAIHIEGPQKDHLLALALADAEQLTKMSYMSGSEDEQRSNAIAHVTQHLNGDLLTRGLGFFQSHGIRFWQLRSLLDRSFTRQQFELARSLVEKVSNLGCRAELLAILARQANEDEKTRMLAQASEQTKDEQDAHQRSSIYIALAKQATGDQQAEFAGQALQATLQTDGILRRYSLIELLPVSRDQASLLRAIRKTLIEEFEDLRDKPRQDVLYALDAKTVAPPIFSASTPAKLVESIIEVCWAQ